MPLLFLVSPLVAQSKTSRFTGEYYHRHQVAVTSEDHKTHVQDRVKIQSVSESEAQILVETFANNLHSCQLVGKAQLEGDSLVFKFPISPALNRGKKAQCTLKITKSKTEGTVTVDDKDGLCKLQFCGQQAELGGQFKDKLPVEVQDKN